MAADKTIGWNVTIKDRTFNISPGGFIHDITTSDWKHLGLPELDSNEYKTYKNQLAAFWVKCFHS